MRILWYIFYTFATPYEQEALRLASELHDRDIDFFLFGVPSACDWMTNCLKRIGLMQRSSNPGPIGLLDADLYCIGPCDKLREASDGVDILTHHRPQLEDCHKYCSGITAFLTPRGRQILEHWAHTCDQDPDQLQYLREQLYLYYAITHGMVHEKNLTIENVGDLYNYVPAYNSTETIPELQAKGVQIIHGGLQGPASRRYLKQIGGSR